MQKLFTKISSLALVAILGIGMMSSANTAYAGYAFNTRPEDCDTTSVVNVTTGQGTEGKSSNPGCWSGKSITVRPGETFNLKVYFRNTGDAGAENVRVRMSKIAGTVSAGQTKQYSGHILVGGGYAAGENVQVHYPSDVKIELIKAEFEATGAGIINITGDSSLFTEQGRLIASHLAPNLNDWGTVKAAFRAVAINDPVGSKPSVTTNSFTNLDSDNGSVTLRGIFNANGLSTTTCFQYRKVGQSGFTTIDETNQGNPSSPKSYSTYLNGLSSGTYEYRACARNSAGESYGSTLQFTIDRYNNTTYQCNDGIDNDGDGYIDMDDAGCSSSTDNSENSDRNDTVNNLSVVTNNASPNNNGSVVLYGNYYNSNYYVNKMNFEYRKVGGSRIALPSAGSSGNASRGFSYTLTGLSNGNYEFRACADNGTQRCGSWVSFSMNRDNNNNNNNNNNNTSGNPSAQTLPEFGVESTNAIIDGFYNMNGCSGVTYFRYGTSASVLNSTTGRVNRTNSGNMTIALTGLQPSTTYYYQAVAENCNGTSRGTVESLTTRARTTTTNNTGNTTTVVRNVTTTSTNNIVATNIGGGARYIRLMIDNNRDTVARGEELVYDVAWENISNVDIRDLVLEVTFPKALQIVATDRGQIDRDANAIYINISELRASEKDDITVRTRVVGSLKDGDPVTARVIIAFENPENRQAQENAIAYDADTFVITNNNNVLGASIFGLGGLGSLAGWLFLILLLILVILVIRYMTRREEHHHYYSRNDAPVAPQNAPVVRHDDDDYTPYRPTSRD